MPEIRKEAYGYFKGTPGFSRAFKEMRKKWRSYGRASGVVKLPEASEEERRALEGFLGRSLEMIAGKSAGKSSGKSAGRSAEKGTLSFSMQEFENALQETRFAGLDLQQLLELYFGEEMKTRTQQRAEKEEQLRSFFEDCRRAFLDKAEENPGFYVPADWITAVYEQKAYGYQILLREWNRDPQEAEKLVMAAGRALGEAVREDALGEDAALEEGDALEANGPWREGEAQGGCTPDGDGDRDGDGVMLAVLAAGVSGNPHFFDRGTAAGQLFTCGLCWHSGAPFPASAEGLAALYGKYGILMDEVSSMVAVFGLHLEQRGRLHPGAEGFLQAREPFILMQKNLDGVTCAYGEGSCVFVVENEMVFSHLIRACSDLPEGRFAGAARSAQSDQSAGAAQSAQSARPALPSAILCTMGQPRKAAWQLLDLLAGEDMEVYYSGDLDPEGMDIADRMWKRHPKLVRIWRMGPKDYERSASEEEIDDRRLSMLRRLKNPQLLETAKLLLKKKKAGYQEALLDEMISDIRTLSR